jgi:glycosyltransferase involved in cell wall biosynthesis
MILKLTCKLFDGDAWYFIKPMLLSKKINAITLYRDQPLTIENKVIAKKLNGRYKSGFLKYIWRFLSMCFDQPKASVFVGIYEIPHGLLVLIVSKLLAKPSVICIIGNPKYKFRNNGFRGWITKYIYQHADIITVTGSESKKHLSTYKNIDKNKIFILPNSIPLELFQKKNMNPNYDLITLGRLSEEKGLFRLLDIIVDVKKELPTIKLGIAGSGPLLNELEYRIKELNLMDNVDMLGYVEDAAKFLSDGKIFISCSSTEGLPRSTIQSMACGTPVIATNVGDQSDLVVTGKTGILIKDAYDKTAFVYGICSLLTHEDKRKVYAENAIKHAQDNFGDSSATIAWDSMISYLIAKKRIKN